MIVSSAKTWAEATEVTELIQRARSSSGALRQFHGILKDDQAPERSGCLDEKKPALNLKHPYLLVWSEATTVYLTNLVLVGQAKATGALEIVMDMGTRPNGGHAYILSSRANGEISYSEFVFTREGIWVDDVASLTIDKTGRKKVKLRYSFCELFH